MERSLRPLLPASTPTPAVPTVDREERDAKRPRRPISHLACNRCRSKKLGCDGRRPTCTSCGCARASVDCVYRSAYNAQEAGNMEKELSLDARERRLQEQTRLLELLRSLPGPEAVELLQRFRSTSDTSRVLSSIEGSFHGETRPSDLDTARAILPPTESSIEFELMAKYGTASLRLLPTSVVELTTVWPPELDLSASGSQVGPGIPPTSTQGEMLEGPSETNSETDQEASQLEESDPSGHGQQARITGPRSPPQYCDSRLERLGIRYWTKVQISNELAATLISFYLENDHRTMGFFDADLFLDDLVVLGILSGTKRFLTNGRPQQEYTAVKPQVSAFRTAFLREAEMLWKGEASSDSVLSVAAIEIFSAAIIFEGNDTLGTELSMAGRLLAERLGLVGSIDGAAAAALAQKSPEWARATSHIAWGAYGWLTLHVIFFHHAPILFPPALPVPENANNQTARPSSQGTTYTRSATFTRVCKLWTIAEEVMGVYLSVDGRDLSDRVPLAFAEAKFRKLLEWAASLTVEMRRSMLAPADLVVFHIWFHVIVTIIFRPFTSTPETDCLMSFTSTDSHPKQIYAASVNQLRDIILNYRTYCSGSSFFTPFINPGLFTLSLALLEDRGDPQRRSYFLLCIRCWRDLYASYPVFRNIVQAFLSMAMQKDAFTAHESKVIMEWVEDNGRHHAKGIESFTTFIFDPTSAAASESQINAMALKFDEMILFDEFTTGTDA